MSVIEVKDLCFSYNDIQVLENISFSSQSGEFVGIFGPNGGGKTTLLYLLMGFLSPMKGTILLFGKPPKSIRKKISWVPQNFHFDKFFPISVKEVVLEGRLSKANAFGWFQKNDYLKVEASLEQVGMKKYLHSPFFSLSGGQQQRVLIARALVSDPELLLLDEPTASVDFEAQNEIYSLLRSLKGRLSILMVTHDLKNAVNSADSLLCVNKQLTPMSREQVCEHFAIGLYHSRGTSHDLS